jgi:hypothetical protein
MSWSRSCIGACHTILGIRATNAHYASIIRVTLRLSEWLPLAGIALGAIISQILGLQGPTTAFFALFSVFAAGYLLGQRLLPTHSPLLSTWWGSLSALAVLMLARGVWFYLGGFLNTWGDTWTTVGMIALTLTALMVIKKQHPDAEHAHATDRKTLIISLALTVLSVCGFLRVALAAAHHATTDSIRTPWPLMPWWTLTIIGGLWMVTLVHAWITHGRARICSLIQVVCAIGATVVMTPLLYTIGYGFDGFLHVAGETVLKTTGLLQPKPPYYMGQYVLVVWLSRLFDIDLAAVDRWLVPMAAMTLIPSAMFLIGTLKRQRVMNGAALVLIPLNAFIATTPNGFATALGVTALLLTIGISDRASRLTCSAMSLLFALWSALTHPLIGLPILCVVIMAILRQSSRSWMKSLAILAAFAAGISVPLVFGIASGLGSSAGVNFDLGKLANFNTWWTLVAGVLPWVPNRYALWAQAAEWIVRLLPWITLIFAGLSLLPHDGADEHRPTRLFLLASASTFLAAIVLHAAGDFGFLIDYERGNYADRLFFLAQLLLIPLALPEFMRRLDRVRQAAWVPKIGVLVAIGFLGAGSAYAALPRNDAVTTNRGWSMGQADIDAVKLIDEDAGSKPYTVLANQSVSAAAVKTFGFKRYNGDVFFYPIPTGGPLYEIFLRASYEDPSRDTMREAARLGGSDQVYFVVNDYWWDAANLAESAASSSDRMFTIQNGKVKVFKYEIKH